MKVQRDLLTFVWGFILCTILWMSMTHGTGVYYMTKSGNDTVLNNYDGDGKSLAVTYPYPLQRVVVTYPGATELLIQLGVERAIVGTVESYGVEPDDYARVYSQLPIFSAPFMPSTEEVLALHPQLIIGWSHHLQPNGIGSVYHWHERGIATYVVPATVRKGSPTLESTVYPFIQDMGRIFHVQERAQAYENSLRQRVAQAVAKGEARGSSPTVLVLQSYHNGTYGVYGNQYIIHNVVRLAGARNMTNSMLNMVGPERVLAFDPDYIVYISSDDVENYDEQYAKAVQDLRQDSYLQHMRAVDQGHIIPVRFSDVNNGNGRVVHALETIVGGLEKY